MNADKNSRGAATWLASRVAEAEPELPHEEQTFPLCSGEAEAERAPSAQLGTQLFPKLPARL